MIARMVIGIPTAEVDSALWWSVGSVVAGGAVLLVVGLSLAGWLARLLTHRVDGLNRYDEALSLLTTPGVIKAYVEING